MLFNANLFKAYDIRGVVPAALHADFALALGRTFGTLAAEQGETTVAVGRDGRWSGPELARALMQGLQDAGMAVIDIGLATTPMLYFATHTLCTTGIAVTGSHNPRDDNGFKMVLRGSALYGPAIQDLRQRMERGAWVARPSGSYRGVDVLAAYRERIVGDIRLARHMNVVVDCGNGVAGASAPDILRAIGCDVTALHSEVDGNFPNHHPDPSKPENLRDVVEALHNGPAEIGLAFDGDGDRLGVVTKDGSTIYPDRQLLLFAQDVLSRVPGGTVVYDVKCSQQLAPAIAAAGGKAVMYKSGHSMVKAKMREVGAALGGEMSGHIFFQERWYGFDDGTYAACRLLEILSRAPDANAVLHALPQSYSTPELHIACDEGQAHRVMVELLDSARTAAALAAPAVLNDVDGLRVDWPDGFGLVRASNTTPALVLRFEGTSPEALARIQDTMLSHVRTVLPAAQVAHSGH